jgi:hypothetical protein
MPPTKLTPLAKAHHYVPEMLLRHFTDGDGFLWFFSKRVPEKGVLRARPKELFHQRHLNTALDRQGNKDLSLEAFFAQLEGAASAVLEKMRLAARALKEPGLTPREREVWDAFLHYQWKRSPDFVHSLGIDDEALIKGALAEFEETIRPLTEEERDIFAQSRELRRIANNARVDARRELAPNVQGALASKGLGFAVIHRPRRSFAIGSRPVVKLALPGRTDLRDRAVEVWLPIAWDVAVCPFGTAGAERVVTVETDRHVRQINEAIFRQSTMTASPSRDLLLSLVRALASGPYGGWSGPEPRST